MSDSKTIADQFYSSLTNQAPVRSAGEDKTTAWANHNPEEWDWLKRNAASKNTFALSLLDRIKLQGNLSDRQAESVRASLQREKRNRESVNLPVMEGVDKLTEAFNVAKAKGRKKPKLRFPTFTASMAPDHGVNKGCIYINNNDGAWLGTLRNGRFITQNITTQKDVEAVSEAMKNPLELALAYARMTTCCSVCGIKLTNPESIERGIGPICAESFGF